MAIVIGRNGNDFRQCQILNEKSNYSYSFRSLGELRMIVWEARVKGDLSVSALETSSGCSLGQLAPHLSPGEDLQSCDNGSSMKLSKQLSWVEPG